MLEFGVPMAEVIPTAKGSLEGTPLGHLLVYALDRSLTGTLVLEEVTGKRHAIYFKDGGPAKAKLQEGLFFLGRVLLDQSAISEHTYERTLALSGEDRKLHGQVLLAEGALDERALREALREQLSRQILCLLGLPPSTLFGYYDRLNLLERWGGDGVRVKPLALIWRGLRDYPPAAALSDALSRFGEQPIELHVNAPIRRFRFEPREQALIDVLRAKPQPLAELVGRGLADEGYVRRLLYALIVTRQLESGLPGVEPIGVDEAPSSSRIFAAGVHAAPVPEPRRERPLTAPPRILTPSMLAARAHSLTPPTQVPVESAEQTAFKTEIRERAARAGENYYAILGVQPDAIASVIQAAFFQLAKKWHPDRLGVELADVKDLATRVFSRMSEAHQTLSDPARRKEYDDARKQSGGSVEEQEQVLRVVRAVTAFQKAEVLIKRNNLNAALEEAKRALDLDPTQADYIALVAWLETSQTEPNLEDILARIERATRLEPNNTRIRWYRGLVLQRMGKVAKAIGDFRFIVENNPRHVNAQREIRLYEMRRAELRRTGGQRTASDRPSGGAPAPSQSPPVNERRTTPEGGRFGKWFKR